MGTLSSYAKMTIAEANKRAGYDGMANILGEIGQRVDFIDECPWYPASHGAFHNYLQAKRLGTGAFGYANEPVPSISSQGEELTEPVKLYHGDSEVSEVVLNGADDVYAARDSEDALNLEGMIQDWIYKLFYASGDPKAFLSLAQRRASLGTYCISCSGSGSDLTSLWVFEFGPAGFHLRYNKGGTPGFTNVDRGLNKVTAPTGTGNHWAWIRHYEIWAAIVLRNQRALIRLANIETTGSSNNLIGNPEKLIQAKGQLPSFGANAMGFCNRTLKIQIDTAAFNKSNAAYSIVDIKGFGPMTMMAGLPIRVIEPLLDTESALS